MNKKMCFYVSMIALFMIGLPGRFVYAQESSQINPALLKGGWNASWITCPGIAQRAYGVFHFRKQFTITNRPAHFVVHISADNRYRFFVNGEPICSGPARGDLGHWFFETVDIAPYLHAGANTLAALVWNMAEYAPVAQITNQTGFLLQGDGDAERIVNSDKDWKVLQDTAYQPCSTDNAARLHTYMVTGPGDAVKAAAYPWGWEQASYDDSRWETAKTIAGAQPDGYGSDNLWTLVPRNIPLMYEKMQRIPVIRVATGIQKDEGFLQGTHPLVIPAHSKIQLLLDQTYNIVAYPQLMVSGGKGATVKLSYAEALFDANRQKGNRNDITGKTMIGNYDLFYPDGGMGRSFRPLWVRTYRYLQLDITTGDETLQIDDLYGNASGYPFQAKASFKSNDSSLQQIWDIGWRTARLCAGETYFDCPYYEQLQYEGDTRIQSLISLYVTGDDRLMRKALLDFYHSRIPVGLTQGRYPSSRLQVIPTFSLFWVSMLHDYWMHRKDDIFLRQFLIPATAILDWYEQHIDAEKNMLGPMDWWSFVDWDHAFPGGTPDGANSGNSSIVTLQYVQTLEQAADLFQYFHQTEKAAQYRKLAAKLRVSTYQHCFDTVRMEMANTPAKKTFSQHASILAVLTGSVAEKDQKKVMEQVLHDQSLSQATFYYRYYLTRALIKAGMADQYYAQLTPWRGMIANGLTTFAENPDPTRSDCHAWSASPNYDFLATICGIMPDASGFSSVRITPALGELQEVIGNMPHPLGMIEVHVKRRDADGVTADVNLPKGLKGRFIWHGHTVALHEGSQKIVL